VSLHTRLTAGLVTAGLLSAGFGAGIVPSAAQDTTAPPTATTTTDEAPIVVGDEQSAAPPTTGQEASAPPPTTPDSAQEPPAPEAVEEPAVVGEPTEKEREEARERRETAKRAREAAEEAAEKAEQAEKSDETKAAAEAERLTGAGRTPEGLPTSDNPTLSIALPGAAPIGVPNFFIEKFRIPPFLLPIYQAAGIEYGVRWEILAAINEIETDYGRNLNVSSAGAQGWMQFMPATWKSYGVDANRDRKRDPYNPVDAIFAAARYLKAAGADKDIRKAIFAYNHADWYVESVLMRARLIGGLPADLVGSLTGLTQGRFPVDARARYADDLIERAAKARAAKSKNVARIVESTPGHRGIDIFARPGARVVAVQDGRITKIGRTKRLGRFLMLRDVYGNTYTYARLGRIARTHLVPREHGKQASKKAKAGAATAAPAIDTTVATPEPAPTGKERLFAHPTRPKAYAAGGREQLEPKRSGPWGTDLMLKPLKVGSRVTANTTLGTVGRASKRMSAHMRFEIRPAGRGAPRIDPKPILDGWKLLESTAVYRAVSSKSPFADARARRQTIGQILLLSKAQLQRRVLTNPRIEIYPCGRLDIRGGIIDRRVLATLEFLASSGLKPTVTSLQCGHGYLTASGNVSEHTTGTALDIARINGIPIMGHQGPGSVTDMTIRRLLTLQGTMKPHQIISLMTYEGADNTLALPDHADHIHIGFRPQAGGKLDQILKPSQWFKLIDRLNQIENPEVPNAPSEEDLTASAIPSTGDAE